MTSFAQVLLDELHGKPLESAYDHFNRANAYAELDRHEEAIADYDTANGLSPDYETGMAWFNRGNSLLALGRIEDALASFDRALEAGTREWPPFLNAALTAWDAGHPETALSYYDRYLALGVPAGEPGGASGEARVRKAHVLIDLGREAEASEEVELAVAVDDSPEVLEQAGDYHAVLRGAWELALPLFERAWDADPTPVLGAKLGLTLANVGREPDAIEQLRAVIAAAPEIGDMVRSTGWRAQLLDPTLLDRL